MGALLTDGARRVLERFKHHPANRSGIGDYHNAVRNQTGALALWYEQALPDGDGEQARAKATALSKLQEAMFWANSAIALAGVDIPAAAKRGPFIEIEVEVPAAGGVAT